MVEKPLNGGGGRSHQLDACTVTGCPSEAPVTSDQRNLERFCERDVDSIIGCQVVPQIPYAGQKETMRIAVQRESGENRKRRAAAVALDLAADRIAAERVRDLDIDQVRGRQCLAVLEPALLDGMRIPGA